MQGAFPSNADLSDNDREALRDAFAGATGDALEKRRPALAGLFRALGDAVSDPTRPTSIDLETVADLDEEEIESVIAGSTRHADRAASDDQVARGAFFTQVCSALRDEQRRRREVLARIDQTIAWYELKGIGR
jgi:hypothetical protein